MKKEINKAKKDLKLTRHQINKALFSKGKKLKCDLKVEIQNKTRNACKNKKKSTMIKKKF